MTRANKALVVMVLASLGVWGCAQEQNHGSTNARIRALESKNAKLEEDFQAVVAARAEVRNKLRAAEQKARRVEALAQQRDDLLQQVKTRTDERDALQIQFDQLRKGIRSLLGQADSASLGTPGQPVTVSSGSKVDEKS